MQDLRQVVELHREMVTIRQKKRHGSRILELRTS